VTGTHRQRRICRERESFAQRSTDEWNALTYAGITVWNVHNEKTDDGYKGGTKRRPRATGSYSAAPHPALITEEEAEAILPKIRFSRIKNYRTRAKHLLTGMLHQPDGAITAWRREYYRLD